MKNGFFQQKLDHFFYDKKEVHRWAIQVKRGFDDLDKTIHYKNQKKK